MSWLSNILGSKEPAEVRLHDAEREAFLDAKQAVLDKARIAVTDHTGKRLTERRWRQHYAFLESL